MTPIVQDRTGSTGARTRIKFEIVYIIFAVSDGHGFHTLPMQGAGKPLGLDKKICTAGG